MSSGADGDYCRGPEPPPFRLLRDHLKAKLSASGHESGEDRGPAATDLADRIKALKAANTIEATPQRVQRKQAAAEEPITARIRRRQEESAVADQAAATDAVPEAASEEQSVQEQNSPARPPTTFQERIALERQQNGESQGQSPG